MEETFDIAQRECRMFERNIAHLARRAREVRVYLDRAVLRAPAMTDLSTPGVYTGFLAGLDEGYLQLCKTTDQALVLIERDAVVALEATGRTLWANETERLSPESVKKIEDACMHFIRAARSAADRAARKP